MAGISRRRAVATFGSVMAGTPLLPRLRIEAPGLPNDGGQPEDEAFWRAVRGAFDLPEGITNLDNGAYGPPPRVVMDDLIRYTRDVEALPATRLGDLFRGTTKKVVIPRVASLLGAAADEVAIVRNATEALDTVLLGCPLRRGDEIVCSAHDFWAMLDALEQRRAREGVVLRVVHPPVPAKSLDDLARLYEAAITPRTKLVLVTHASNITGQLYPVRRIAAAAHKVGAEVVVDGAQTLALLPYTVADLDCDYFGASLHKWLLAPIASGVLWMRRPLVEKVWPLVPAPADVSGMGRFMSAGTYPEPIAGAAGAALEFHERLGGARKADRLRYLTQYWRRKIEALPNILFYTSTEPDASCGLAVFEIAGVSSDGLASHLFEKHRITVRAIRQTGRAPEIKGIRVTANVYTSLAELDRFVASIEAVVRRGL
jgi:isopenicillin-N epimerase